MRVAAAAGTWAPSIAGRSRAHGRSAANQDAEIRSREPKDPIDIGGGYIRVGDRRDAEFHQRRSGDRRARGLTQIETRAVD